jgi:hypothetical protein
MSHPKENPPGRIGAFDVYRGILVIGMIVFHTWFHLFDGSPPSILFHWVPSGFVLCTGILLGMVLSQKKTGSQIFWRGLKLFLIFLALNIPVWIYEKISFYRISVSFIMGNASFSSFEILLPIAITIMISPLLLRFRWIWIGSFLAFLGLFLLDIFQYFPFTLKFLLIGILGIFLGRIPIFRGILQRNSSSKFGLITLCLLILLLLSLAFPTSWTIPMLLSIFLLLGISSFQNSGSQTLIFFGQYSLILYIFHVALLQILKQFSFFHTTSVPFLIGEMVFLGIFCTIFLYFLRALIVKYDFWRKTYSLLWQ